MLLNFRMKSSGVTIEMEAIEPQHVPVVLFIMLGAMYILLNL